MFVLENRFFRFIISLLVLVLCFIGVNIFIVGNDDYIMNEISSLYTVMSLGIVCLLGGGLLYYLAFELFGDSDYGIGYVIRMIFYWLGKVAFTASQFIAILFYCFSFSVSSRVYNDASPFILAGAGMWLIYGVVLYFTYCILLDNGYSTLMPFNVLIAAIVSYVAALLFIFISRLINFDFIRWFVLAAGGIAGYVFEIRMVLDDGLPESDSEPIKFADIFTAIGNFFASIGGIIGVAFGKVIQFFVWLFSKFKHGFKKVDNKIVERRDRKAEELKQWRKERQENIAKQRQAQKENITFENDNDNTKTDEEKKRDLALLKSQFEKRLNSQIKSRKDSFLSRPYLGYLNWLQFDIYVNEFNPSRRNVKIICKFRYTFNGVKDDYNISQAKDEARDCANDIKEKIRDRAQSIFEDVRSQYSGYHGCSVSVKVGYEVKV